MKTRIFIVFLGWIVLGLPAGERANSAESTKLEAALRAYRDIESLKVDFTQNKILKSIGTSLKSTGRLQVVKNPRKIVWEILKPSPIQVVITDDEMKIIVDPGQKTEEVQVIDLRGNFKNKAISQAERAQQLPQLPQHLQMLTAWLNLDVTLIQKEYAVTEMAGPRSFRFVPHVTQRTGSLFQSIEMSLGQTGYLEKLVLAEISGDSLQIHFQKPVLKKMRK